MSQHLDRHSLSRIAPKLAEMTQSVLFGDMWARPDLSLRERSLITLAALMTSCKEKQLPWHIEFAQQNGLKLDEIKEVFTHLAFYAGWPAAVTALSCLTEGDS